MRRSSATTSRRRRPTTLRLNIWARIRKLNIGRLNRLAAIPNIRREQPRATRKSKLRIRTPATPVTPNNIHNRAVHVHLAIPQVVEPRPRKDSLLRSRRIPRHGKLVRALALARTPAFVAAQDAERLAAVDGQCCLTGSAVVVGAADDGEVVGFAGGP